MKPQDRAVISDLIRNEIDPILKGIDATREQIAICTTAVIAQTAEQRRTNELLKRLIDANQAFVSTLTSFLNEDHKLRLDQERKALEHAKSLEPTKDDLRY